MASYFDASYPEPWQLLGITLRPFSLGHYLKLQRLDCAFVSEKSETATLGDLLLGVLVCSLPSDPDATKDPFWVWLNRQGTGLRWRARAWVARRLGKEPLTPAELDVLKLGKQIGLFDLGDKARLFADYIKAHSDAPPFWDEPQPGEPRKSGAHWAHAILSTLVSKCGYTQEQAYNASLSKALADYFRHAEAEGCIRLMTPEEVEFTERAHGNV